MDSMSISQFKGILESEFCVDISDGYLFRDDCTLTKLVEVVKIGSAPDDDEGGEGGEGREGGEVGGRGMKNDQGPALAPPGLCCEVS